MTQDRTVLKIEVTPEVISGVSEIIQTLEVSKGMARLTAEEIFEFLERVPSAA